MIQDAVIAAEQMRLRGLEESQNQKVRRSGEKVLGERSPGIQKTFTVTLDYTVYTFFRASAQDVPSRRSTLVGFGFLSDLSPCRVTSSSLDSRIRKTATTNVK